MVSNATKNGCGVAQTKVSIPSIAGIYYASSGDHG